MQQQLLCIQLYCWSNPFIKQKNMTKLRCLCKTYLDSFLLILDILLISPGRLLEAPLKYISYHFCTSIIMSSSSEVNEQQGIIEYRMRCNEVYKRMSFDGFLGFVLDIILLEHYLPIFLIYIYSRPLRMYLWGLRLPLLINVGGNVIVLVWEYRR